MLLYLEGLDAESIGDVTGLSTGHVRVQMHRIRTILSRQFHGEDKYEHFDKAPDIWQITDNRGTGFVSG
jgi:hypothetical protein